jgi:hypothetical protein
MADFVAQGGTHLWTATIRDGNGDLADCPDLALMLADPDGNTVAGFPVEAPAVVRTGLGEYEYEWAVGALADLGVYDADWSGTVDGLAVGGSDSVQVVQPGSIFTRAQSYATLVDLQTSLQRAGTDDDQWVIDQMETALVDATDRITEELETDFFRHPAAGTEVRLFAGSGSALLHAHAGIVSLTQVRIRTSRTGDWVTLTATDYDLESRSAPDPNQPAAIVYPYDHIRLNGTGDYSAWPKGERLVEMTGAFGWPSPPRRAVEATVAMARQLIAADRTYPGGVVSPDEAGMPILPTRLPDAVYRLKAWASNIFYSCSV